MEHITQEVKGRILVGDAGLDWKQKKKGYIKTLYKRRIVK